MVRKDGEKMSKRLGNLVFVDELRKTWDPRAIRLAVLEHHYRHSLGVGRGHACRVPRPGSTGGWAAPVRPGDGKGLAEAASALDDDLDTPGALAAVDDAVARGRGRARRPRRCSASTSVKRPVI